jgi:NAD+ synthase
MSGGRAVGGDGRADISRDVLAIDCERVVPALEARIRELVARVLRKRGVVVGMSGGVDSSVVAALCARALGGGRVLGILMPEGESDQGATELGRRAAAAAGIETLVEDVTPILDGAACYRRRDDAIRLVIPEYGAGWRCKIVLPSLLESEQYRVFSIVARAPDGREIRRRLTPEAYLGVVAATNFKQRARKMVEYYHADRCNYAVAGTPNRLEYDQGFFVKNGDGAADIKPIAHLYKTQVYRLAEYLGVPEEIRSKGSTTDTWSLPQTQEEFYFSLPLAKMDLCLWARNHGVPSERVAPLVDLSGEQVERVYRDIDAKRRATRYLHLSPLLAEEVPEVGGA